MKIQIMMLDKKAKPPRKALEGDAAYDIFSNEVRALWIGESATIKTGFAAKIETGFAGFIWDKSGLSHKYGVKILGGVIDSNYTGEWMVGLINLGKRVFRIEKGQKIAQVVFQKVEEPELEIVDRLSETNRGSRAFGHTGRWENT